MFKYNGSDKQIINAVKVANDEELINYVSAMIAMNKSFDMCDCVPEQIANVYKTFLLNKHINVEIYYPKWRYSKAMGYFTKSKPRTIHINGYKLNTDVEKLISLMHHEAGHIIDNYYTNCDCNHGDNNPIGKESTFQYSINRYVYEFLNYERKVNIYIPWWKRLLRWIF